MYAFGVDSRGGVVQLTVCVDAQVPLRCFLKSVCAPPPLKICGSTPVHFTLSVTVLVTKGMEGDKSKCLYGVYFLRSNISEFLSRFCLIKKILFLVIIYLEAQWCSQPYLSGGAK